LTPMVIHKIAASRSDSLVNKVVVPVARYGVGAQ